jgi:hypothetical protein
MSRGFESRRSHDQFLATRSAGAGRRAPPKATDLKRRRFLLALGAGGAGAAAVATQTALGGPVAPADVPGVADSGQGYRETEHVLDYYATTRI